MHSEAEFLCVVIMLIFGTLASFSLYRVKMDPNHLYTGPQLNVFRESTDSAMFIPVFFWEMSKVLSFL